MTANIQAHYFCGRVEGDCLLYQRGPSAKCSGFKLATSAKELSLLTKKSHAGGVVGAGLVGAVGKISTFRPKGPQFDPGFCRNLS